jgi:hypothetical protein
MPRTGDDPCRQKTLAVDLFGGEKTLSYTYAPLSKLLLPEARATFSEIYDKISDISESNGRSSSGASQGD